MQAIAHLFDRWNASLATGDPDAVAKLYADNAALLPALSDRQLVGREQIRVPGSASSGFGDNAYDQHRLRNCGGYRHLRVPRHRPTQRHAHVDRRSVCIDTNSKMVNGASSVTVRWASIGVCRLREI
jgi:Calcium/calmodulin dependent protein kinase II association domain